MCVSGVFPFFLDHFFYYFLFFCFFFQTKGVCVFCFCLDSMLSFVCLFFLSSKTVLKLFVSLEEKNEKRLENLSQNQNRFWSEKNAKNKKQMKTRI